jgi:hypothetical protein
MIFTVYFECSVRGMVQKSGNLNMILRLGKTCNYIYLMALSLPWFTGYGQALR